ncbi:MAG: hypothetical protein RJB13_1558 [Pseudomonadota bacterium]
MSYILKSSMFVLFFLQMSCKLNSEKTSLYQKLKPHELTISDFSKANAACFDRKKHGPVAVVDSHLHSRPFGGKPVPFTKLLDYMRRSGVIFATLYGIGQRLPVDSRCTYYLDCPGTPVLPSLKNDFYNAQSLLDNAPADLKLTLSMTFPDLAQPGGVLEQMGLLNNEYPGMFRWMGEVNLVKQALFKNQHSAVSLQKIAEWAPFMNELKRLDIPVAFHSDIGNDNEPFKYLPQMEEVLKLYPDNKIIWLHLGLSKELKEFDKSKHVAILENLMNRYSNLTFDIAWRVLYDQVFSNESYVGPYVELMNKWPKRFITGTDFVASEDKSEQVYSEEVKLTSAVLSRVDDTAYRQIALGQNYFDLLKLGFTAPQVCGSPSGR